MLTDSSIEHSLVALEQNPAVPMEDVRVCGVTRLITPAQIKEQLPASDAAKETVVRGREAARRILRGEDPRLLVVVGPCSIHDPVAAIDYAARLAELRRELSDKLEIMMRVYFEKPRTTVGWKGLINDPHLDDSCDLAHGIALARRVLLDILAHDIPAATEFLDPVLPQYTADLISWSAIGARTTESQTHRELASGLSMPVGFKNGTDGSVQTAIDAMSSSRAPHSFLGIDQDGATSIIKTLGNPHSHLVLRGGRTGANYSSEHVKAASEKLQKAALPNAIMVDCSHANSGKDPARQPIVWRDILEQRRNGCAELVGAMIESNIGFGSQSIGNGLDSLKYGVSITDGCLDWESTAAMLREA